MTEEEINKAEYILEKSFDCLVERALFSEICSFREDDEADEINRLEKIKILADTLIKLKKFPTSY